jgi:drug/metabolite transporter (DMT)-like permease
MSARASNGARSAPGMSWTVLSAIAFTIIIWASAFVAIRSGLQGYPPGQLAALRFVIASLLLGIRAWLVGVRVPERRDWLHIFATGVAGFAVYALLVNLGETHVAAGMASFVVNMMPVFTTIMAVLFLGEHVRGLGWVGVSISLCGVALLGFSTTSHITFEPYVLILVAAAISQAAYFTLQKPLVHRYGGVAVTSWAVWSGTLCLLPFFPSALHTALTAPSSATLAAVYLGVLPTVVGYSVWAWVNTRMPVGRAAAFLYFVPVVATLIGWFVLRERPTALGVIGGLIAISGVALVNLQGRRGPSFAGGFPGRAVPVAEEKHRHSPSPGSALPPDHRTGPPHR